MTHRNRICLIGTSLLIALTEAALRTSPDLDVWRFNETGEIKADIDMVLVEISLPQAQIEEVAHAYPNASVLFLGWNCAALLLVSQPSLMDTGKLLSLIQSLVGANTASNDQPNFSALVQ